MNATSRCLAVVLAAAAACSAPDPVVRKPEPRGAARPVAIANAGFENAARPGERCPERWDCTMHADPDSFLFVLSASQPGGGRQSLCIERVKQEPWALATQASFDPSLNGKRLRLTIAVRVEGPPGTRAGPWLYVHGRQGQRLHEERVLPPSEGWQRISVEIDVPNETRAVEFGAILYDGGRACVDDVRLEVVGS